MELLNLNKTKKQSRRLTEIFDQLSVSSRQSLLDYGEWLAARVEAEKDDKVEAVTVPLDIPRPEQESVVKAIKRLVATYPMVDRGNMLNETSSLMTQHVIQGKEAAVVIDELEVLFKIEYEKLGETE